MFCLCDFSRLFLSFDGHNEWFVSLFFYSSNVTIEPIFKLDLFLQFSTDSNPNKLC